MSKPNINNIEDNEKEVLGLDEDVKDINLEKPKRSTSAKGDEEISINKEALNNLMKRLEELENSKTEVSKEPTNKFINLMDNKERTHTACLVVFKPQGSDKEYLIVDVFFKKDINGKSVYTETKFLENGKEEVKYLGFIGLEITAKINENGSVVGVEFVDKNKKVELKDVDYAYFNTTCLPKEFTIVSKQNKSYVRQFGLTTKKVYDEETKDMKDTGVSVIMGEKVSKYDYSFDVDGIVIENVPEQAVNIKLTSPEIKEIAINE